jgi:surface antigen
VRRLLLGLAGTLVAGVLSLTPTAAHAETTMCSGRSFDDTMKCDPGWAVNMMFMHWRMYRGHNCTNYVAWRLTRDGVQEPGYLLGNARSWADRAKRHGVPVTTTPEVGAVGTWSGRNHVVYVEQVAPTWLLISEDSWSSKRYRRYIAYKGERNYPTKFIHFAGKNAIRGATPTVTGTPLVGQVLRANVGVWSPKGVRLTYRWLRNGVVIPAATGTAYRLTRDDAGKNISVSVTGTYPGKLPRTASSLATSPVSAGTITPATPQITGDPIVGSYLVAVPGAWSPSDVALTYQWYANGKKISGADERTWKVGKKRVGNAITVRVTGSGPGFEPVTAESSPSPRVVKKGQTVGRVTAGTPAIVTTTTMMVGDRLKAASGTWGPAPVKLGVKWLRNGVPIPGATTWTYTLTAADVGKRLRVEVTGVKSRYLETRAQSAETGPVYERKLRAVTEPKIVGNALVGETLTAMTGTWLPNGSQASVSWTRDGKPIPGARGLTYVATADDLKRTLGATIVTQFPKFAPVTRKLSLSTPVRAVPMLSIKAVPSEIEHGKRLRITARGLGRQLGGAVRIVENGKRLNTVALSPLSPSLYDYKTKPGTHVVTFVYVGPDWLVPTSRVVTILLR